MSISPWIKAARLRTLPLALSCILAGTAIAVQQNAFKPSIFILAIATTLALQILSNFANDYGDALSGKDKNRQGEQRMVASGIISPQAMKKAIIIVSAIAFALGIALIIVSFKNPSHILVFLAIGLASIWAAIKYTAGKNPYGYSGYGDLFVFLFFGLVGVLGTSYLYTQKLLYSSILPALSIGFLSTAVLSLNNLRDIENDAKTNKNTTIVQMGFAKGKAYFALLIIGGILSMIAYAIIQDFPNQAYLFLLAALPLSAVLKKVLQTNAPKDIDAYLKPTALSTFAIALLLLVAVTWII